MPDWDEMEQRERDALVAEEVMGWSQVERHRPVEGGQRRVLWKDEEGYHIDPSEWNPTTDISAAWRVVEEMHPRLSLDTYADGTVDATFIDIENNRAPSALCNTAPEAICLAALRAKGVDV